jgi:hypothetical protein
MERGICAVILAHIGVGLGAQNTAARHAGSPKYGLLLFGVFSLFLAAVGTCTGETWARFGRVIRRDEKPKEFWEDVVACYVIGFCFIGYFLYVGWR